MRKNKLLIGVVVFPFVVIALVLVALFLHQRNKPEPGPTPKIAGQKVPDTLLKINFEKRYDFYCEKRQPNSTVFRNCKIVGFTGGWREESEGGSGPFSSRSIYRIFDGNLVLELPDGRLAYVPPSFIEYFEETLPKQ